MRLPTRSIAALAVVLLAGCGARVPAPSAAPSGTRVEASAVATTRSVPEDPATATAMSAEPTETTTSAPVGTVIYSADWSSDLDGWTGNEDWTAADGELLCRGQENGREAGIVAPIDVEGLGGYAVEAEIRLLRYEISNGSFGVMVGIQEDGAGYAAGHDESDEEAVLRILGGGGRPTLDARPYLPGAEWHSYRIEVRGNELTGYIDGAPVLRATDNTYLTGRVGLWSSGAQLVARSVEVSELS